MRLAFVAAAVAAVAFAVPGAGAEQQPQLRLLGYGPAVISPNGWHLHRWTTAPAVFYRTFHRIASIRWNGRRTPCRDTLRGVRTWKRCARESKQRVRGSARDARSRVQLAPVTGATEPVKS